MITFNNGNIFMIVSFVSQKGGVGKSTLARGLAVEFLNSQQWDVHVADMDTTQLTALKWANRRDAIGVEPSVDVASYRNPQSALRAAKRCDLLVVDGTPYATQSSKELAKASDLVVIPTGITMDDLEPQLNLAQEMVIRAGIPKNRILFVIMQVTENGEKEAMKTRESIKDWGFNVVKDWMPAKTAYGSALDAGYSMTETRFKSLNEKAQSIIDGITQKIEEFQ